MFEDKLIILMKKFNEDRGVISVFLAAFIIISFLTTGILFDIALVQSARADAKSMLQLSSNMILSNYDKDLFNKFGLFAVSDLDIAEEQVESLIDYRFEKEKENDNFLRRDLINIDIVPEEDMRLCNPKEMERQILQFMEWRTPALVIDSILSKLGLFQDISEFGDVFANKFNFDKQIKGLQDKLENISGLLLNIKGVDFSGIQVDGGSESGSSSTSEEAIWKETESISDLLKPSRMNIKLGIEVLEEEFIKEIRKGKISFNESMITEAAERSSNKYFSKAVEFYDSALDKLNYTRGKTEQIISIIDELSGENGIAEAYDNWGNSISSLKEGEYTSALRGDYLAKGVKADFEGYKNFGKELGEIKTFLEKQGETIKEFNFRDISVKDLSVDKIAKIVFEKCVKHEKEGNGKKLLSEEVEENLNYSVDGVEVSGKIKFSDESITIQKNLHEGTESGRGGLIEFVKGWNAKRKAIKRAKEAMKDNAPNVEGSIYDYGINESQMYEISKYGGGGYGNFSPIYTGSENEAVDSVINSGDEISNIIPQKNVLDLAVDKVSIFSYLNGMFSNRLSNVLGDGENSVSLMGDKLSDRILYRCELEYILYGNDNLNQNLSEAVNRIRVLRFISNLIYAFTSNELQTEVSAVAFAVAGWTGFGVPFVQSALLAVLAICETGLDTSDLLAGKSVPILKSPTTWKCSLSGIKPVAEGVITDIFDQLRIETESGIEAFEQSIDTQLNELKNSCMNMVEGNVSVPLQKIIEDALTRENEPTADEIQAQYIEVLSGIGDEIGDGGVGDAMQKAVQNLSGNSSFGETVYALISKKKDSGGKTKDILAEGNTYVEKLINPATREASSVVDSVCDKWKEKSSQILDKGEEFAQKEAARWISGLQKDLGTKDLSAKMSTGSILTMNYQDYLALFLIIHLITDNGKNQLLNNAAKLIHVESEGVDISRASSGFRQEIKEDVFVFFLDNLNYLIPFTGNSGKNRYEIRQVWVEGYGIYN